ncbi:hypothetical protein KEM56_006813 [Ascosphaera pollenicola]|nr:hypothetical protein KEM56_006813 [Ascosphaera pollenicola]
MRFVTKFYVVALLATCTLTYFAYELINRQSYPTPAPATEFAVPSGQGQEGQLTRVGSPESSISNAEAQDEKPVPSEEKSVTDKFKNRLVVLGDSSSSDSIYQKTSQGRVWTDLLCSNYECTREVYSHGSDSSIAVVDSHELELLDQKNLLPAEPLPDLAAQMDAFIAREKDRIAKLTDGAIEERRRNTIFVIQFGLWDVWRLIGRPEDVVQDSINRSIDTIFKQLGRLVDEFSPTDVKVLLMGAVDVTFLPAYTAADGDRQAIEVSERWNKELRRRTEEFKRCSIFLVDVQSFLVDQFRLRELWSNGYIENDEFGREGRIPWLNVRDACLDGTKKKMSSMSTSTCKDPEKYLFWDAMHFGPGAQKLLAADIYRDIKPLWLE